MHGQKKVLEIKSLSAGYDHKVVIRKINLTVSENDFIGLIGANGSGKSTLLKVIMGMIEPLSGTIDFFSPEGKKVPEMNVGYLPQFSRVDTRFPISAADVVRSGLISKKSLFPGRKGEERDRVNDMLQAMGIAEFRNRPFGTLSGGQQQRVFLARALVSRPRMLLLDEPDNYVDHGFETDFFTILNELNKNMAIILVSHDMGMISSYVRNIACLNKKGALFVHDSNEITQEVLDSYSCPIELITHGKLPHRVLLNHEEHADRSEESI